MLETVQFAVKVYQLDDPITEAIAMAGPVASDIMRVGPHGRIAEGQPADFILLSARSLNEMMCRPQSDRVVVRNGVQVTDKLPDYEELDAILR
jgi:cytosine deaminase